LIRPQIDSMLVRYHAFTFAYDLAKHYQNEVTYAYLLVTEIFIDFYYPASICLLATIFGLLFQIFQRPQTGPQRHRRILWLHYAFCGLLFVIYITIFGLEVRGLYTEVFDGESIIYFVRDIPVQDVVNVVFDALYAGASFEIFVASIIIFSTRTNNQAKSNVWSSSLMA